LLSQVALLGLGLVIAKGLYVPLRDSMHHNSLSC
jgi:hypothetical protein